jgi:micrococcal nuclease
MYEYKAKLIKVVDGDTVDAMIDCGFSVFRKERIRLKGIRTRDKEEKKKGLAAKARLQELIKDGKNEFIVKTSLDKKGKYGRLLGELYQSIDILTASFPSYNEILLEEGHATVYGE